MPSRQERLTYALICAILYFILIRQLYPNNDKCLDSDGVAYPANIRSIQRRWISTNKAKDGLKHILIWNPYINPFHLIKEQQESFHNCEHANCYVTYNKKRLENVQDFDAVIFTGVFLMRNKTGLPPIRSLKQKYVYAMLEPSASYPLTNPMYDNFFNWTMSYRLDSDVPWKYIRTHDVNGRHVGPAKDMKWLKDFEPISDELKEKFKSKTKAAAWFVSHCKTASHREEFVKNFIEEFEKYGRTLDVYGFCESITSKRCNKSLGCLKMLERDYYFYFSFENSFDEDYVTEKLTTALNNYVVPVVYGGANYFRFLPPGSYLNARELGPIKLAKIMDDIIKNTTSYYDFFRWTNHYKYQSFPEETTELCNLCSALNNDDKMKTSIHREIRLWWNGPVRQKTYEFMLQNFMSNNNLLNLAAGYNFTKESNQVLMQNIANQSKVIDPMFIAMVSHPKYSFNQVTMTDANDLITETETKEANKVASHGLMKTFEILSKDVSITSKDSNSVSNIPTKTSDLHIITDCATDYTIMDTDTETTVTDDLD